MAPNFKNGEKGVSFIFLKSNLKRGDVVVIDNDGRYIIKRIVGLPGEHIKAENNILYINGKPLEEDYLADSVITSDFDSEIKEDEVFCLGDNRQNSSDSRSHGPFKISSIISKGFFSLSSVFNSDN